MRRFFLALGFLLAVYAAGLAQGTNGFIGATIANSGGASGPGGVGCVPSGGASTNIVLYGASGACQPATEANVTLGALTLGASASAIGTINLYGSASGEATLTGGTNGTFTSASPWSLSGLVALTGASNALGTPLSITLTNGTALPIGGLTGLGSGVAAGLAAATGTTGGFIIPSGLASGVVAVNSYVGLNASGVPVLGPGGSGSGSTFTQSSVSSTQTPTSTNCGTLYTLTAAATINLPHSTATGITTACQFGVYAQGGAGTIAINGSDKLNNGTAGTGATLAQGATAFYATDAAGNWWPVLGTSAISQYTTQGLVWINSGGTPAPATFGGTLALSGSGVLSDAALPLAGGTLTGTVVFPNSDIELLGSSSGHTTFTSANASATNYTTTFPAANITVASTANINTALPSATTSQLYGGTGAAGVAQVIALGTNLSITGTTLNATGGSGAGGTFNYSDNGVTLSGTAFVPIGGGGAPSATEANVDVGAPSALTVTNLQVGLSAAPGVGNSVAVTLRDAGTSQVVTCTVSGASATSCSDITHSFNVAQGDLIDWQVVTTGTIVGTPTLTIAANSGTSGVGVTSASVASANGFAGTVATATTTPAITLSTTVTGIVKGNGTALSAATAGTDYVAPGTATSFTAPQRTNTTTPTIATTTFTPNFNSGQNVRIAFPATTCTCTIANPSSSLVAGQSGMFELVQGATSASLNPTWGSAYIYAGGTTSITLTTTLGGVDYLPFYVDSTASVIVLGGIIKAPAH